MRLADWLTHLLFGGGVFGLTLGTDSRLQLGERVRVAIIIFLLYLMESFSEI